MEEKIPKQDNQEDIEEFSEEKVLENIRSLTSEKLADVIVLNRYLNIYGDIAKAAMVELGVRRDNGDVFNYEEYINVNTEKLPKIQMKMPHTNTIYNFIKDQIKVKL